MANEAVFKFLTARGIADKGQEAELKRLAARLSKPGAKLLLHLHGGLIDEDAGKEIADRLSGAGGNAFNAGQDWTQVYVIWRTGALEEIERNWKDLLFNDRLYQAVVRKLISYAARRLVLPGIDGRSAAQQFPLDDDQILQRMLGQGDTREPFADIDEHLATARGTESRALLSPDRSTGELIVEFNNYLAADELFKAALADMNAAANDTTDARTTDQGGAAARGQAMIDRLDDPVAAPLQLRPSAGGSVRGVVPVGITIVKHVLEAALRVFERFRNHRDHGLHATVVEEVCREFYSDRIGATIWGWMIRDADLHFSEEGFGKALFAALPDDPDVPVVVTAHSAGSIWASRMLIALGEGDRRNKINLCLLAPAVRHDLFAKAISTGVSQIERCHMYTMSDELERRDAVLGHDLGFIYPSSLLYLVSGLFEKRGTKGYVDAPLVGMQRFVRADWFDRTEKSDGEAVDAFFMLAGNGVSWSKDAKTDADTHGGFDDNQLTLASVKTDFLVP